jgi:hypothetical protein
VEANPAETEEYDEKKKEVTITKVVDRGLIHLESN